MRMPFLAIALLLLAACPGPRGTTEPSQGTTMPPQSKMPSQQPMEPAAPAVNVQLTEYAIEMPDTLTAGMHTFTVTNAGTMKHNFAIEGPGVMQKLAGDLMRGDSAPMPVMLQKGTYTVYCPVDGHRGRGMSRTITVQ
jgi:plastocyanin